MRYILDEGNSPVGISLWYPNSTSWTDYHFIKNLQGDVLEVYKVSDKSLVASYTYDSWGNILTKSGSLATINPFRYRSYYFDEQTWFYYLQSRYYDPAIGRFINADVFASTGQGVLGYNMFAYCGNNPIHNYDPQGTSKTDVLHGDPENRILGGIAGGAACAAFAFPAFDTLVDATLNACREAIEDVYEFSKAMRAQLNNARKKMPHVHHIVPVGQFKSRSETTQQQIIALHDVLSEAGINRFFDPMNLMLVSAGTHASLHTDQYIAHVYEYIMATDKSKEQIYLALFVLRLEIAAQDTYANGY